MRDRRPNRERPVRDVEPSQLLDPLHVDEMAVLGKPELHEQQQLRPAGIQDRVVAVALQELSRLLEGGRRMDLEGGKRHAATGVVSERTSRAASTPSPTETSTPRSASPRPSAERPTTTLSEREATPMWPIRKSRSA